MYAQATSHGPIPSHARGEIIIQHKNTTRTILVAFIVFAFTAALSGTALATEADAGTDGSIVAAANVTPVADSTVANDVDADDADAVIDNSDLVDDTNGSDAEIDDATVEEANAISNPIVEEPAAVEEAVADVTTLEPADDPEPAHPDGWSTEDGTTYYYQDGAPYTGWVVDAHLGNGLERYWVADGILAQDRLIDPAEGSGYWAYTRPEGYVVRDKWDDGKGHVYLADNDGRLCERIGWVVTGTYDNGRLQRYWVENAWGDYKGARTGLFNQGGSQYYGIPGKGFVFRNGYTAVSGLAYHADNGGRLSRITGVGISRVLGIDAARYIAWLMSHEHDGYYLGTTYRSGDWRSPRGDTSYNGAVGTNCTGFVWHTYVGAGANPYSVPHLAGCGYCAGDWGVILNNPAVPQYYFGSKEEMLASGVLSKGDVIWVWDDDNGGRRASISTNHIGIFWGDTASQDRFWHAPSYGNVIGPISSGAVHKSYTVLKL